MVKTFAGGAAATLIGNTQDDLVRGWERRLIRTCRGLGVCGQDVHGWRGSYSRGTWASARGEIEGFGGVPYMWDSGGVATPPRPFRKQG